MDYLLKEQLVFCFHFFVLLGLFLYAEVSDSCVDEDIVPLDEFADVAWIDSVFVPVGQHLSEPSAKGSVVCLLGVDGGSFESLFLSNFGEHLAEGDVVAGGEHRDICERYNLISRVGRHAFTV